MREGEGEGGREGGRGREGEGRREREGGRGRGIDGLQSYILYSSAGHVLH